MPVSLSRSVLNEVDSGNTLYISVEELKCPSKVR